MPNLTPTVTRRRWYYADPENQSVGPLTEDNLRLLRQNGVITAETMILPDGSDEWTTYGATFNEALATPPPLPVRPVAMTQKATCPFCAEEISPAAKKCKHCGETLDVALRAAEEAKRTQANQPMVFMNAAGGGVSTNQKKRFPHLIHLLVTVLTLGWWGIIWLLHYLFRDRNYYQ